MVVSRRNGVLRSGQVAALLGISGAALRQLEARGSIPVALRDGAGRRVYSAVLLKQILTRRVVPGEHGHE